MGEPEIDPVDVLERWRDAGGTWRIAAQDDTFVTFSLLRCDGGEEVERLTAPSADVRSWLLEHGTSEEPSTD